MWQDVITKCDSYYKVRPNSGCCIQDKDLGRHCILLISENLVNV